MFFLNTGWCSLNGPLSRFSLVFTMSVGHLTLQFSLRMEASQFIHLISRPQAYVYLTIAIKTLLFDFTALHCTTLHCTALHCTALHCTALHCTALHCTALHCTAMQYTVMQCTTPHYTALLGNIASADGYFFCEQYR